ncbi:cardiac-enriched FHL2-interacting protein isoform X2 [Parambassis ranga]|uniref:Cardiac-enriched FHL2-interacting protein isoform X2 n=1 Tax=Parambassis ranga TaxID=210632 RepID=A0A6P7JNJ5_9TELE|nr:uncharacterized protein LOC114446833 isoform X2 [Parambassis ranga]
MTSIEKRRSGRKSGSHRKHSDGGYSDTSSGGSFLDENDREVSSLTDRAFRSLCIGDEAVYNDSDLSLSSPCTQRDRQLAFSHSDQDREDTEREELKRAAHENFSLRVQQYGQDWVHGGMYGAEIHRDPQWEVNKDWTHGRVSATFQHSYVETTQQANTLREEQLSFLSNGATELSSQQRRSRSRVSSLIRAFNSEEHRDGAVVDERLREWNDETTWDKSALMSIQRELSEFSTSYQQNYNSGNFYSSEVAAMAHMSHNSAPSFMRSSHSKHSMSAQVNCNSNFFIHSEFSPFRVWRDYNRFPFQHGQVSGFMHCSEYETPMYKELSLEDQQRGPYRGNRHLRSNLAPVVPSAPGRSTSTSTMLQKAAPVEKRCESELAGHYPHRKRAQSLGPNRLPSQRPSTASPTIEMSRRVRDTISSVKALQQKIKMMTAQNITTGVIPDQQERPYSNQNLISISNNIATAAPNVVSSNTSTTPFNISQLLTPFAPAHQEVDFQQYGVSPQPVEHPPVRAESRGATPDVRMSSYKSRATNLLFNLKDNRKRVKSTYSPTKFKGMESVEKSKQPFNQEPRETVIDMPDFPDPYNQLEESRRTIAAAYQYSPGVALNFQPPSVHTGQYPEYSLNDYQPAQMVHHAGFTDFIPENYSSNQLANGQNLYEDLAFASYKKDVIDNLGTLGGNVYTPNPSYTETSRLTAGNNKSREYLISKANAEQPFNETVGRVFTKVERYEQLQDNRQDYNNVSSQDWWRQTNSQDTEQLSVKAVISPWKQEMRKENLPNKEHKDLKKPELVSCSASNQLPQWSCSNENQEYHGQQQLLDYRDKNVLHKYSEENEIKGNYVTQNYYRHTDQEYRSQHASYSTKDRPEAMQETNQRKQYTAIPKIQDMQPIEAKTRFEQNLISDPGNISAPIIPNQMMKDRHLVEVKAEQVMPEPIKAQHTQTVLAKAQQWAQVEQSKAEAAKLILAGQAGSEKVTTEEAKSELTEEERAKQPRETQPERVREDQAEADTTREQRVTVKPRNITGDTREELSKQVKAEQAEAERLKEEHIKIELPNTEQAKMRQAKTEQVIGKRINAEQVEEERVKAGEAEKEAERIRTEKVNVEQTAAECRDAEATKTEQMKETKAEQVKTNAAKVEKVKSDHIKVENVRQAKDQKDSVQVGKMNAEETTAHTTAAKDAKREVRKSEQTTLTQTITEKIQERSAKLTTKLTATKLVKSEPDKVEQVKTELAKAKAELAKIKEKMRSDQKDKARNTAMKEANTTTNNKNEEKKQDQAAQIQQKDESLHSNKRGADDYDRLREKYGLTDAVSTNKTKESTAENNVSSNDFSQTQNTSLNKVETVNKETSNDGPTSRLTADDTENKEGVQSFSEGKETLYVYSESSKEFKLSSADYCFTDADKITNGDSVTDTVKNDSAEKHEALREIDGSQQNDSVFAKVPPVERKPKSTEPNVGPAKDLNFTPPKALSQKDRAQTKQEILTSKIKAHAEKEISAIKEKGFAKRDGIISKSSIKQLAGNVNIRQKPPSLDMSKKPENKVFSINTQKHKMELSGAQNEQVKSVSPPNSATTKPAGATTPLADHLHPQAPQNSLKTNSKEPKQAGKESSILYQEQENQSEITLQNNEQSLKSYQRKEQANHRNISGEQKENPTTDNKKVNLAEPTGVKAAGCKLVMTEKAENKEAAHKDTEPSIGLPVADDSLQIMGIMVTVRERKPSVSTGPENNSAHKESKEHSNSVPDKCPNTDLVLRQGKTSQKDVKSKDTQETEDHAKVRIQSPENEQKTSTLDTRKNAKLQREAQADPFGKKDVPFTVTVPAKNKAETQPLLCKQNTTEPKDCTDKSAKESSTKSIRTDVNENVIAKVMNTGIKNDAETLTKQGVQPPPKEDKTPVINKPKSSTTDGKSAPEKRHESTPPQILNKASSSDTLALKHNETHTGGNNQDDDNVHIDRIAIRVVPVVLERGNVKMVGKHPITTTLSDVVPANDHKHQHTAPSSQEEKVNNENLTPVNTEKKMRDSVEDRLGVQHVLSSVRKLSESLKNSTHQNSVTATSEITPAEQPEEGDYFQVQGLTETSNKQHNNSTSVVDASRERELPELPPNRTAVSNESHKEEKHEAFVFHVDQGKNKTVESDSKSTQEENMKRKNWEAHEKLASKQTDGSTERWSNIENMTGNQTNHIRKHHTENHPGSSERQSLRNSTRESTLKEKPEIKPKPKERVSTIPEISALADYARLKVIVSEDREADTVQELPPNKKEGFFPLIQSRHSRRPVFTADPQDLSVKEKGVPNKTEMNAKVNKEPKAPVFPITEKEHQRTGMFKLGDKERQEKIPPDNKVNHSVFDNVAKNPNHKERNNPPTVQTGQTAIGDTQSQVYQGICQPNNYPVPPATSSSLVNMPRNTSERQTSLDKNVLPQSTVGEMHHRTGNLTPLKKGERTEKQRDKDTGAKTEEGRTDKIKTERTQQTEKNQMSRSEEEKREEAMKIKHMIEESRASLAEEEKRASQREEKRRAREREAVAAKIKEKREKQREAEKISEEEGKGKQKDNKEKTTHEKEIKAQQRGEEMRIKETDEEKRKKAVEKSQAKLREGEEQKKEDRERRRNKMQEEERDAKEGMQGVAKTDIQRRSAQEEQQRRAAQEEQQRRTAEEKKRLSQEEQQRRALLEEQERRVAQEEQQRKATDEQHRRAAQEEQERRAAEEKQRRAAQEEQQRRAALEEQQGRAAQEEQQRRAALEEQQRRMVQEEQQRRAALEEQQRRAAQEEQQRRAAQEEQERRAAEEKQRRAAQEEQQRRAAQEEQQRKATDEQHRRAAQEEQERRAAEETQRRAAQEEQQRRAALEEQQGRAAQEEQQRRAALEEQQRRTVQEEQQRRAALEEQQRRAAQEEQQRRAAQEEQERRAAEEKQRRAAQEEQQRRAALEEQQRRAAQEEQQRRAAQEEQQRRAAQEEQERRAAEEKQRRDAQEEHQRRAAQEEQERRAAEEKQRRAAQEEQQRRATLEEQQRKATEEQHRRAAQEKQQRRDAEEKQRRAAQEEEQRRAAEEKQRRAAQEEQERRAALEEHQRRAAEEQHRRAAQEEQQRRDAEEKQRRAAQEEEQRRAAEEKQRRAAQEEQERRAALEEHQRRAAQEEQQRRAAEEKQRRTALEEQQRRAAQEEEQRRAAEEKQRRTALEEQQRRAAQEEEQRRAAQEEQQTRAAQEDPQRRAAQEEQQRRAAEEKQRRQREDEKASHMLAKERIRQEEIKTEQTYTGQERERHYSPDKARHIKENEAALKEKKTQEMLAQREDDIQAKKKKEEELAVHREQVKAAQTEKQRSTPQMDTLQYYAITDSERKPREKQLCSPLPLQHRNNPSGLESNEELASHSRPYRPHAPASPAPSLPRSNTSSPAVGTKPSMFRVKDNTTRGSSSIKSVIPRFHKNFGEDFRVGSPMDRRSERGEEEQEIMRCSAGTPVYPDTGLNQLGSINESSATSSQDYTVPIPHHRPYSRRSIAMDEEDSRSVVSNMSEGMESFATSVADLADIRGLYDYDRPESACSFSSDVSRSLGKPPAVPPKSEKALRRAKRLTTRRIKKELSKAAETEAENEVSGILSSYSTEVRSSNRHAVASPHFSPPVSLTHAPALGSSLPSSQTEHSSSQHSFHASPHATGPISIPVASPHATTPVSLPNVSPHATGPASHLAPPKAVAHVSSSPTLHHANHPAPVTQYQVETSYPQPYPLTQRKVLQDPGSGQYFVVDLPVQVKTKTFFDPETGKYVQLNVRESGQSISRPRQQPQLQCKMQIEAQQQPISQAEKPYVLYQGYHDYPKGYQPAPINNVHSHRSSDPVTLYQQDQQPVREGHSYGYPAPEPEQNSEGRRYSPEKTPYMDTVNNTDKTHKTVYSTYGSQESFPKCDTNSQPAESSVCENDTSAHSRYQPRDIITMSELEDFMEVSDW